jgi:hypothetical protein
MHNDFDSAVKEILSLSNQAIIPFLNANFSASHPPDAPIIRTNTEYRLPSRPGKGRPGGKTVIADRVFLVGENFRKEMEDVRRSREEAVSRAAELEQSREEERRSREEAVSRAEMDRQRTARNILRLGLSVEQVTQATGLPQETVQTLAAQL